MPTAGSACTMPIATWTRPPVLTSCALAALCFVATVLAPPPTLVQEPARHPLVITIEAAAAGEVISPPAFADAAAWPRGMVIALPPNMDPIQLGVPVTRFVDRVLTALLEPLLAARS